VAGGIQEGEACSAAWHEDLKSADVLRDASSLCKMNPKTAAAEERSVKLMGVAQYAARHEDLDSTDVLHDASSNSKQQCTATC
jgi:hypothetical protein